jgi:hypothetical protein
MKSHASAGNPKKVISPLLFRAGRTRLPPYIGLFISRCDSFAALSPLRGLRVAAGAESITLGSSYDCQR